MKDTYKLNPNIDLHGFRIKNRITQAELAEFLCTSMAFISLIENGRNKLPFDKIKKILSEGRNQQWYVECLVPAYERIMILDRYLREHYSQQYHPSETNPLYINKKVALSIFYGEIGITNEIADTIILQVKPIVQVSRQWLISGEGEMILNFDQEEKDLREQMKELKKEIELLNTRIKNLEERIGIK